MPGKGDRLGPIDASESAPTGVAPSIVATDRADAENDHHDACEGDDRGPRESLDGSDT